MTLTIPLVAANGAKSTVTLPDPVKVGDTTPPSVPTGVTATTRAPADTTPPSIPTNPKATNV